MRSTRQSPQDLKGQSAEMKRGGFVESLASPCQLSAEVLFVIFATTM
jgi:hypothetical protein